MFGDQMNVRGALHWWIFERVADSSGRILPQTEDINKIRQISIILPFTFQALDALYIATRDIPSPWVINRSFHAKNGGNHSLFISIPLSAKSYLLLRTVLALASDVYLSCKALKHTCNLRELKPPVTALFKNTGKFWKLRCFFAHFDEVVSNPRKHGITGAANTSCGIEYTNTATECRHLVLTGDKIYFSYETKTEEVNIEKSAFDGIFNSARLIYDELTSHKVHAQSSRYLPSSMLYQ